MTDIRSYVDFLRWVAERGGRIYGMNAGFLSLLDVVFKTPTQVVSVNVTLPDPEYAQRGYPADEYLLLKLQHVVRDMEEKFNQMGFDPVLYQQEQRRTQEDTHA